MDSIIDYQGRKDTYGRLLKVTAIAIADELCSASELVKGKLNSSPAAIIRNYKFLDKEGTIQSLLRPKDEDLFR